MLRFEYDKIIAFHPYRTYQPWDNGGIRLLHVDGFNGLKPEEIKVVSDEVDALQRHLADEFNREGGRAFLDNHCGYTVWAEAGHDRPEVYYQIRFSDGSLYVWLMPGPPEASTKRQ